MRTEKSRDILLRLVGKGQAIIAGICALADNASVNSRDFTSNLHPILLPALGYFDDPAQFDSVRESDNSLVLMDEELRNTHLSNLERIYHVFESVLLFCRKFSDFLRDLDDGIFIQESFETFLNGDGKQLASEALYMLGLMLLLIDRTIPGLVREKALVAYRRWRGAKAVLSNFEQVCTIFRSTSYQPGSPLPPNYPESFFERLNVSKLHANRICASLRTDDIYHQIQHFPSPDHRSVALSTQASLLFVSLFFVPEILHDELPKMREIVDRHFPDNFVVSYYMGHTFDLADVWDRYRAAKSALAYTVERENVKRFVVVLKQSIADLNVKVENYLKEGVLTEEYVLENINRLMETVREANVAFKWMLLHQKATHRKLKEIIAAAANSDLGYVELLFNTAQLEYTLKEIISRLLQEKASRWATYRAEASNNTKELGEYFSGQKELTRVQRNESLQTWFANVTAQIRSLDQSEHIVAGRNLVRIIHALEEIQDLYQMETSMHIRTFIAGTVATLKNMIRLLNAKESIIVTLSQVTDFSYAWDIMPAYIGYMQAVIQRNPSAVKKLRATFLKLTSAMDIPLIRINQADSNDLVPVSQFYSSNFVNLKCAIVDLLGTLVKFVENVLHVIPETMFNYLDKIIDIRGTKLLHIPQRLEKFRVKE